MKPRDLPSSQFVHLSRKEFFQYKKAMDIQHITERKNYHGYVYQIDYWGVLIDQQGKMSWGRLTHYKGGLGTRYTLYAYAIYSHPLSPTNPAFEYRWGEKVIDE